MTQDLADRLVDLSRSTLAKQRPTELFFDRTKSRLNIASLVVVCVEFLLLVVEKVEQFRLSGLVVELWLHRIALEWDVWHHSSQHGEVRIVAAEIRHYSRATRLNPNHDEAWCGLGEACFELERYEEALETSPRPLPSMRATSMPGEDNGWPIRGWGA